jgi:hypothetical protein
VDRSQHRLISSGAGGAVRNLLAQAAGREPPTRGAIASTLDELGDAWASDDDLRADVLAACVDLAKRAKGAEHSELFTLRQETAGVALDLLRKSRKSDALLGDDADDGIPEAVEHDDDSARRALLKARGMSDDEVAQHLADEERREELIRLGFQPQRS